MSMTITLASVTGASAPLAPASRPALDRPAQAAPAPEAPALSGDSVTLSSPRDAQDADALLERVRGLLASGPDEGLGHRFDPERLARLLG